MKLLLTYLVCFGVLLAAPATAQWVEQGDAGDLPATAQVPAGAGALTTIAGTIVANDADMYCINITDTAAFFAETCAGANYDTQLFLFRSNGLGINMNDDSCSVQSRMAAAAVGCANFQGPGQYLLAISRYNRDPIDAAAALLWAAGTGEHCADGPGAANVIAGWLNATTLPTTPAYTIRLGGVSFCGTVAVEQTTWGSIKNVYR